MSLYQQSMLPDVPYQHDQPNGTNFKTINEEICQETAVWFYPALKVKYNKNVLYNILYNNKNRLIKLVIVYETTKNVTRNKTGT